MKLLITTFFIIFSMSLLAQHNQPGGGVTGGDYISPEDLAVIQDMLLRDVDRDALDTTPRLQLDTDDDDDNLRLRYLRNREQDKRPPGGGDELTNGPSVGIDMFRLDREIVQEVTLRNGEVVTIEELEDQVRKKIFERLYEKGLY